MGGKFLQGPLDAVSTLVNGQNIFCSHCENDLSDYSILRLLRRCKNQTTKLPQKKLQNTTIDLSSYIFRVHTLILLASFFIHFVVIHLLFILFCQLHGQEKINIVSMFHFKRTKKYEMRTQTYVDNIVNDMHYEVKLENCVRDKNNFFIK